MNYDRKSLLRGGYDSLPDDEAADWLRRRKACDRSLFYFIKDIGGDGPQAGGGDTPPDYTTPPVTVGRTSLFLDKPVLCHECGASPRCLRFGQVCGNTFRTMK